ncbi:hypothetical protein Tco_1098236 [Tanacetum coccineum]
MWKHTTNQPPLPPIVRKMPDRPRKKRIRAQDESNSQIGRVGRKMTCSNCQEIVLLHQLEVVGEAQGVVELVQVVAEEDQVLVELVQVLVELVQVLVAGGSRGGRGRSTGARGKRGERGSNGGRGASNANLKDQEEEQRNIAEMESVMIKDPLSRKVGEAQSMNKP